MYVDHVARLSLSLSHTHAYSLQNAIPRIVNLECCVNLKFLVLSDNQIRVVRVGCPLPPFLH